MSITLLLIAALTLAYLGMGGARAILVLTAALLVGVYLDGGNMASLFTGGALLAFFLLLLLPNKMRREKLSRPLLAWVRGMLPRLSDTEAEALKSGSVDWDGELFSGRAGLGALTGGPPYQVDGRRAGIYRWPGDRPLRHGR